MPSLNTNTLKSIKTVSKDTEVLISVPGKSQAYVTNLEDLKLALQVPEAPEAEIYTEYVAFLQQSGTNAPVATVHKNTMGGEVVWSRNSAGDYQATLLGAFDGTYSGNIIFFLTNQTDARNFIASEIDDSSFNLYNVEAADDNMSVSLIVRVYQSPT